MKKIKSFIKKIIPLRLTHVLSKEEIEKELINKDFWNYENEPDDLKRKEEILNLLRPCSKILDIGACEGWITKDLNAKEIHAIEISDLASSRFPNNIKRVTEPEGEYDIVIATGVLYDHYDIKQIKKWIKQAKPKTLLVAGIEGVLKNIFGKPTIEIKFPYRGMTQIIRVYENMKILHNIGDKPTANYNTREQIIKCKEPLSFDGIYLNVYENRDILKNKDVLLFYSGNFLGGNNDFDVKNPFNGAIVYPEKFVTKTELDELIASGCKIGWHTWSHPDLTKISTEEAKKEITPPFQMDDFAYPYGKYNEQIIKLVKEAGFKRGWSVEKTDGTQWTIPRTFI